jgi:hypothetical protein
VSLFSDPENRLAELLAFRRFAMFVYLALAWTPEGAAGFAASVFPVFENLNAVVKPSVSRRSMMASGW